MCNTPAHETGDCPCFINEKGEYKVPDKKFDPTKPVQTRDGREVRILCTNRKNDDCMPIVCLYNTAGIETVRMYREDGTANGNYLPALDLVNIPDREIRYINIENKSVLPIQKNDYCYMSRSVCRNGKDYEAKGYSTVKLTFEDGKLISSEVIR